MSSGPLHQDLKPFPDERYAEQTKNVTEADLANLRRDAARAFELFKADFQNEPGLPDFHFDLSVPADWNNILPPVTVLKTFESIRPGCLSRYIELIGEVQAERHRREVEEVLRPLRRRIDGYRVIFVLVAIAAVCCLAGSVSGAAAFIVAADLAFLWLHFGDRLPKLRH